MSSSAARASCQTVPLMQGFQTRAVGILDPRNGYARRAVISDPQRGHRAERFVDIGAEIDGFLDWTEVPAPEGHARSVLLSVANRFQIDAVRVVDEPAVVVIVVLGVDGGSLARRRTRV